MKGGWPESSTLAVCGSDGKRVSDPGDQGKEGPHVTGVWGACQNPKHKGRSLDELSIQAPFLRSSDICAPPCWTSGCYWYKILLQRQKQG